MKLEGKTILVTGAASGLGRATALACAKEGGSLFLVDRDREGLASTQAKLRETGVTAESFVRDLIERQACFDAGETVRSARRALQHSRHHAVSRGH
jgi:short-subunit dehydrogenase